MARQDVSVKAVDDLRLSPHVAEALRSVQTEVLAAYRDRFIEMTEALRQQASALNRIQETLRVLVEHIEPTLVGQLPIAIRVAGPGERPDLASSVVIADPIGMGFTMSQVDVAKGMGLGAADVSVLVRAFELDEQEDVAVVVRRGRRNTIVNYHPSVMQRLTDLVAASPPAHATAEQKAAIKRVRKKLER